MIVLDTDVLIEILDKKSEKGSQAFDRLLESGEEVTTTSINLHEILYGLQKYGKPVQEILQLPVLAYRASDAELSSRLELEAERTGTPIRRTDAMIAAITMNNEATLFTFDQKHFIPLETQGLKLH